MRIRTSTPRFRHRIGSERTTSVVAVIVGHEHLETPLKMSLIQNEQPVEALRADCAHEPLGHPIGLRGTERRANDVDPLTLEHVVKLVGELLVVATENTVRVASIEVTYVLS